MMLCVFPNVLLPVKFATVKGSFRQEKWKKLMIKGVAAPGKRIIPCYNGKMEKKRQRKVCAVCGGTGQVRFFKGESRFLLTDEECDQCAGTGYCLEPTAGDDKGNGKRKNKKRKS